jgi:UDP-4-amino-4,6-dideoxy-N-acetyl-beta-L-altrosamine transaminase
LIPYGRQDVTEDDIAAVVRVLKSDWLTQGPAVPEFEQSIARYCGAGHAIAVSSATSALHIACVAMELGPGDWLWTVPNTFVASANCGIYCGAKVDFVDIDPRTYNISVAALERKLVTAKRASRLPKVLVPVHFSGQSCDMAAIAELGRRYGFRILEDASHAVGAVWDGERVGACRHSDIVVFSFHPVKIITTGEGGMAVTQNAALAQRMRRLRTHGITRDPAEMQAIDGGAWYYEQIEIGFNYRLTDIQAALGLSQMNRLDLYVGRRRELARRYDELLAGAPVTLPWQDPRSQSAWHLYVVQVAVGQLATGQAAHIRRATFDALRQAGIGVNVHYIPVHLQPYYRSKGFAAGDFPEAERYSERAISLPLFPAMSDEQQQQVVTAVCTVLQRTADSH